MTPDMVPHMVRSVLEEHGLWQKGWRFKWDTAKRRAGICRSSRRVIGLSRPYVELNVGDKPEEVMDTILHEVAHALAFTESGDRGHGAAWRAVCLRIGADPVCCYDAARVAMPEGAYRAECGGCGREFRRHRPCAAGRWRYCRACGPTLGRLVFVKRASAAAASSASIAKEGSVKKPEVLDG